MMNYLMSFFYPVDDEIVINNDSGNTIIVSSVGSCGLDLKPSESITVEPFSTTKIGHKLYIEKMPREFLGMIAGRSGLNLAGDLTVSIGIIDSDYRGEISTIITNQTNKPITLDSSMRISQLVFIRCYPVANITCSNMVIQSRVRGKDGFGSSG